MKIIIKGIKLVLSLILLRLAVNCDFIDGRRRHSKNVIGCPDDLGCKCEYDDTSKSGFKAKCHSLNLSSVPKEFGERNHWTWVDLRFNSITMIGKKSFNNIHRVEILKLSHNKIAEIHPKSFKHLQSLTELWLDYNKITSLPPSVFSDSPNIEKLFLSTNLIRNLTAASFKGLHNLKFLSLDNNLLSSFPVDALEIVPKLEILGLTMNKIEFIPNNALIKLGKLKKLFLRENKIKRIGKNAMNSLKDCVELDLSFNNLGEYPTTISTLTKLNRLEINNNQIHHLPDRAFTRQESLKFLSIHHNAFSSVGRWTFINLHRLTSLKILNVTDQVYFPILPQCNQLTELTVTGGRLLTLPKNLCCSNTSLKRLDVSNNRLFNLSGIENCTELEILDANGNSLTELRFDETRKLESLKEMNLENNDISVLDLNSFENMKLEMLNLARNPVSELPQKGLEKLKYLKLSDTKNLLYLPPKSIFAKLKYLEAGYSYHCCQHIYEDVKSDNRDSNLSCTPKSSPLTPCRDNLIKSSYLLAFLFIVVIFSFIVNFMIVLLSVRRNFFLPFTYANTKRLTQERTYEDDVTKQTALARNNDMMLQLNKTKLGNVDAFDIALCHLALSDVIATVYLAIILIYDLESRGHFYTVGAWWQQSVYCRSAGFFLVLGLQLCFYTLFIATIERYLTTMFPLNPERHLRKAVLALAMSSAWVISISTGVVTLYSVHVSPNSYANSPFPSTNGAMCLPWSTKFSFVAVLVGVHLFVCSVMIVLCALMYCRRRKRSWLSSQKHTRLQMTITVSGNLLCLAPLALIGLLASAVSTYPSALDSWMMESGSNKTDPAMFDVGLLLNISIGLIVILFFINPILYVTFSKEFRSDITCIIKALYKSRKLCGNLRYRQSGGGKDVETVSEEIVYYCQPIDSLSKLPSTISLLNTSPVYLYSGQRITDQFKTTSMKNLRENVEYTSDDEQSLLSTFFYPDNPDRNSIYEGDDEDDSYQKNNVQQLKVFKEFKEDPFVIAKTSESHVYNPKPYCSNYENHRPIKPKLKTNTPNTSRCIETSKVIPKTLNVLNSNDQKRSLPEIRKKQTSETNLSPARQMKSHSSESSTSKDSGIQSEPDFGAIAQSLNVSRSEKVNETRNRTSFMFFNPPKARRRGNLTDSSVKQGCETSSSRHLVKKPIEQCTSTLFVPTQAIGQEKRIKNFETTL